MPQYRLSLTEATHSRLEQLAEEHEFTLSQMANHIIRTWQPPEARLVESKGKPNVKPKTGNVIDDILGV